MPDLAEMLRYVTSKVVAFLIVGLGMGLWPDSAELLNFERPPPDEFVPDPLD